MNRNTFYAEMFVDELARAGLRHVCLSPGSRNTPLVLAFAKHTNINVTSHLDERSAAFFALGIATATQTPVALVCTSGSAAANYFPAIVEAHQARVPLLVLTADRPHELRHSGANQTMDQTKLFGAFALWAVDAPLPEAQPSALVVRHWRALAARAMNTANGERSGGRNGVVHVNMPFRPPLEPTPVPTDATAPPTDALARAGQTSFVHFEPSVRRLLSETALQKIAGLMQQHERGVVVCGPRTPHAAVPAISSLAARAGYPLFADGVSGVRFGAPNAIGAYDTFLSGKHGLPTPQLAIRFGDVPTSKWLNQYLDQAMPAHVVHVSQDGVWADDTHRVSEFVYADVATTCAQLTNAISGRSVNENTWLAGFQSAENKTWQAVDRAITHGSWFDGMAVHDALQLAPNDATVFVGNSLSVRHLDQFGRPSAKALFAHANRGVSGIDGNVSTALGLGHGRRGKPLVAIVGDVTLYHDMNGLLAVRRCNVPATFVLLNNNGGGIFNRLGVKEFEPEFTQHFVTPHGLDFAHAAALYGLAHVLVQDRAHFAQVFAAAVNQSAQAHLIEVRTDAMMDLKMRSEIVQAALS